MASESNSVDIEDDVKSLSTLFKEGLDLYNNLGKIDEPTNSYQVQKNVKRAMKIFEKATHLVSYANIFSTNEEIDEIATNDLQYLLLPALLGLLAQKLTSSNRREVVEVSEIYFKDFLKRCNDYGLSNYEFNKKRDPESAEARSEYEQLAVVIGIRNKKIQRFNLQKELKAKLDDLKKNMENEHADEEIKRNYFLTLIRLFIHEAVDEMHSIDLEKPLLDYRDDLEKDEPKPEPKRPPPPLKPVIITRNEVQKAVYGAGYPSIPTMTVQEFYDKRVQDGIFPDPNKKSAGPMSLQQIALAGLSLHDDYKEETDKEKKIEEDDPETLERMRRMDDFKDDHRRGYGNRMNRS